MGIGSSVLSKSNPVGLSLRMRGFDEDKLRGEWRNMTLNQKRNYSEYSDGKYKPSFDIFVKRKMYEVMSQIERSDFWASGKFLIDGVWTSIDRSALQSGFHGSDSTGWIKREGKTYKYIILRGDIVTLNHQTLKTDESSFGWNSGHSTMMSFGSTSDAEKFIEFMKSINWR